MPPSPPFPALHSVLAPDALAALVPDVYGFDTTAEVTFMQRGLNDTYLVKWSDQRAVFRVYRSGWRSVNQIDWELAFIEQVAKGGAEVARPLARKGGGFVGGLNAVEGQRPCALFEFAPGRSPKTNDDEAALYGLAAANLHNAAEGWAQDGRFPLDLAHLISEPIARVRPFLTGSPELLGKLEAVADRTHTALLALAPELEWGACHGDLHEGNALVDEQGVLRLIDFDCAGPGFRAYDLAVYWWSQAADGKTPEQEAATWKAFLDAYQALRPLAEPDRQALPLFVAARAIWFMGLYAQLAQDYGTTMVSEGFIQYGLDFLTRWEARLRRSLPPEANPDIPPSFL